MELLLIVPAPHEARNESWVQCKLRDYARRPVEPPYFQCKTKGNGKSPGQSEFFDARITGLALELMNKVAVDPDKCKKDAQVKNIEWDHDESDEGQESTAERVAEAGSPQSQDPPESS
jgi:hypothetical protein